jgi:hypothetical protein
MEPPATAAIINRAAQLVAAMAHWRSATIRSDLMRDTGEDEVAYAAGWIFSSLVTLATIFAVWIFAV